MIDQLRAAAMRHFPPITELMDAGKNALLPAAIGALLVLAILLLIFGERVAVFGSAFAMVVGFGLANYFRHVFDWWPKSLGLACVPFLFLVAQIHALLVRSEGVPLWGKWWLRLAIGALAAFMLLPHEWQEKGWPIAAFTLGIALAWAGTEEVAKQSPGGNIPLLMSLALFSASMVMAHSHSAKLSDALSIPAASLAGIALVSFLRPTDVSGALPGAVVMLFCVLLIGQQESYSDVPPKAFLIAALPPLTLGLAACPPLSQLTGKWKWLVTWLLCLGPAAIALSMAMQAETLPEW